MYIYYVRLILCNVMLSILVIFWCFFFVNLILYISVINNNTLYILVENLNMFICFINTFIQTQTNHIRYIKYYDTNLQSTFTKLSVNGKAVLNNW